MPTVIPQDDPIFPVASEPGNKTNRPGGGPPGGGPGVSPGSQFGGFTGSGTTPHIFRGLQGFGENIPLVLRKRGIPGLNPGPPGRSDTVPAMLSPGEMVMNRGVTSNPQMASQLAQLNVQGAQTMGAPMGFEHGGTVPDVCPLCGASHGGAVPGYAFGGQVPGRWGTFSMPGLHGPGSQQVPQGGGMTVGQPPGGGGFQYNPEGGVTGGYNPQDPWGQLTQNRDTRVYGQGVRQLGQAGQAGVFDPRGNQMLINSMREGAQGTADALVRRNVSAADLGGLDPAQRAVAKLQAVRDSGRGVQDIMANTRAQAAGSANDFYQGLYRDLLGGDLGFTGQTNQARLNDWQAGNQANREHKDQWGRIGGQVLGAAVGAYAGSMGGRGKHP